MNEEQSNLPVLDNETIRELNSKKVINMVDKIAENMDETRQAAKVTKWYIIATILVFGFVFLGAMVMVAVESGGINNFLHNFFITENVNKRIICSNGSGEWTFREAVEAEAFTKIFNNSNCYIYDKKLEE